MILPMAADSAAKIKTSTTCRIQVWPFDYMVKAGQPARQKVFPGRYATRKNSQIACRFRATLFDV
jgi:hypothetical protein